MSGVAISKGSIEASVAEAVNLEGDMHDYENNIKPLIEEMLYVLECDLEHIIYNRAGASSFDAMLACEYYRDNLDCLNGYRSEAVVLMNSRLKAHNVPEQYRF